MTTTQQRNRADEALRTILAICDPVAATATSHDAARRQAVTNAIPAINNWLDDIAVLIHPDDPLAYSTVVQRVREIADGYDLFSDAPPLVPTLVDAFVEAAASAREALRALPERESEGVSEDENEEDEDEEYDIDEPEPAHEDSSAAGRHPRPAGTNDTPRLLSIYHDIRSLDDVPAVDLRADLSDCTTSIGARASAAPQQANEDDGPEVSNPYCPGTRNWEQYNEQREIGSPPNPYSTHTPRWMEWEEQREWWHGHLGSERDNVITDFDLLDELIETARAMTEKDPRLTKVMARAVAAAKPPIRLAGGKLYFFDGQRWTTEGVDAGFATWYQGIYGRLSEEQARPRWWRCAIDRKVQQYGDIVRYTWTPYGRPFGLSSVPTSYEEAPGPDGIIVIARRFEYTRVLRELRRVERGFYTYRSWGWSEAAKGMLALWASVPARALDAVRMVLPEEEMMLEDPAMTLNTPDCLLVFREDGDIRRFTDNRYRRDLGVTQLAAPLPSDLAEAWAQPWQHYAPTFDFVLRQQLPDAEIRDWLQLVFGAVLTGMAQEDIILWFWGPPGTGKTTLLNGLRAALGTYLLEAPPAKLIRTSGARRDVSNMRGKRLVTFAELAKRYTADGQWLKQLAGGGPMPDRDFWVAQFTLWGESNAMPRFDEPEGLHRRLAVVPFTVPVPEDKIDPRLRFKILHEEPGGILLWGLHGAQRYLERTSRHETGLRPFPAPVKRASLAALFSGDPVDAFGRMLHKSATPTPFKELYATLEVMCQQAGITMPSRKLVLADLARQGFTIKEGHARTKMVWAALDAPTGGA